MQIKEKEDVIKDSKDIAPQETKDDKAVEEIACAPNLKNESFESTEKQKNKSQNENVTDCSPKDKTVDTSKKDNETLAGSSGRSKNVQKVQGKIEVETSVVKPVLVITEVKDTTHTSNEKQKITRTKVDQNDFPEVTLLEIGAMKKVTKQVKQPVSESATATITTKSNESEIHQSEEADAKKEAMDVLGDQANESEVVSSVKVPLVNSSSSLPVFAEVCDT